MTNEEAIKIIEVVFKSKEAYKHNDSVTHQALNMAIEALQRETPKNPIVNYVADSDGARRLNDMWTEDSHLCPVCYTYFGTTFDEGYCSKCGQKLIQKRVRVIEP